MKKFAVYFTYLYLYVKKIDGYAIGHPNEECNKCDLKRCKILPKKMLFPILPSTIKCKVYFFVYIEHVPNLI